MPGRSTRLMGKSRVRFGRRIDLVDRQCVLPTGSAPVGGSFIGTDPKPAIACLDAPVGVRLTVEVVGPSHQDRRSM